MTEAAPPASPPGNGSNGSNGSDDTPTHPPKAPPAAHLPVLKVLADVVLEAKEHGLRVTSLYDMLWDAEHAAPKVWMERLLVEFERHHEAGGEQLTRLRAAVSG